MGFKDIRKRTAEWLGKHRKLPFVSSYPQVNDDGLINSDDNSPAAQEADTAVTTDEQVLVKAVDKETRLEKIQDSFDSLVDQLSGINNHLDKQITQHEELMSRLIQMPQILENLPAVAEGQKKIVEQLLKQSQSSVLKQEQFTEIIKEIPAQTAKQTEVLSNMSNDLAAAAAIDAQMADGFNKFNNSLEILNQRTNSQTDGILQMSKTFQISDRHLKYMMSQQHKRFTWIFLVSLSVCVLAIIAMIIAIAALAQR